MGKRTLAKGDRTVWCERGFFPVFYGFCPDKKSWRLTCKRLDIAKPWPEYPTSAGSMTSFTSGHRPGSRNPKLCLVVTLHKRGDKLKDATAVCGLMVHEAMHIWRDIREDMGERNPSSEFEAYAIQMIFQQLMYAYQKTRNYQPKVGKKKVKKDDSGSK